MIKPSTIDDIKMAMDIVEVVGDFVNLKKSGSSLKALSPFTAEKTPSFYVVPSKGIFKCFSSGKGGDAITFVMEVDGLSYIEALKYLATKYNIAIEEEVQTDEIQEAQNQRESLYIVLKFATDYFQDLLHSHEEGKSIGLSYFKERGFSDEIIESFNLGYSLNVWDHFHQEGIKSGFTKENLEAAGLIVSKENKIYDRFRGRVMFPIHNVTGKTIAFGARILVSEAAKNQPKYLNSPETELYNKSRVLYGLFQSKQQIRQEDNCYLVEGYTDVISMHQVGVKNVVSSSGTALTEDQVKLIKRYTQNVTVLYDGDVPGIRASFRGIDILLEGGLNVRAVTFPDGEDPDSYSHKLGATAYVHFLTEGAVDFIKFKTALLMDGVKDDPIKKAGVVRDIVESISKIGDAIKRSVYLKECSNLLQISEAILIAEQNKILITQKRSNQNIFQYTEEASGILPFESEEIVVTDFSKIIAYQEKESIRVLLNYGDEIIQKSDENEMTLWDYFISESEDIEFTHPIYNKIFKAMVQRNKEQLPLNYEYFLSIDDPEIQKTIIELCAPKYEISEFWKEKYHIEIPLEEDFIKDLTYSNILRLKFRVIQHLIEVQNEKLKTAIEGDVDTLLDEISELKQTEMKIAKIIGNVTVK
ncbi:MAG: DNA primase [Flammeovirgaceae bacterium TMED32]|nr:MAG: DNA primase [Flammeovirgaceae bacterium TMED32]